jgi:hypothetical protein
LGLIDEDDEPEVAERDAAQLEAWELEALEDEEGMGWPERIDNYRRVLQREPYLTYVEGERPWLYGVWRQASFAVKSGYYGGYPGDYLKRIKALFPDRQHILHVFSGMVDTAMMPGDTLDIRPELAPTYCIDAETMQGVPLERYDLAVCDPPYTPADAAQYGTRMVVPGRVMKALERLPSGAYVVWLDEREPVVTKAAFIHEGIISLTTSAGHRCRIVSIFRRV